MTLTINANSGLRSNILAITDLAAEAHRDGWETQFVDGKLLFDLCFAVSKTDEYLFGSEIDDVVGVDLIQYYEKHWQKNRAEMKLAAQLGKEYEVHVDFLTALHKTAWIVFS